MADDQPVFAPDAPVEPIFAPDAKAEPLPGGRDFSWGQTYRDIWPEIKNDASKAWETAKHGLTSTPEPGLGGGLQNVADTARGLAAIPAIPGALLTGPYHSIVGHTMANAEHAVGSLINPEVAAKDDPEKMYETAKGDTDTALSAARPAGAPVKVGGAYDIVPDQKVWQSQPPSPVAKPVGLVKQPDTEEFFDSAENHYSNMRGLGVEIDPKAMNRVADNITTELYAEGYRPRNVPKVFDAVDELRNPAGQNHEISDIDSVRKVLNKARLDYTERDAARRAIGHIDDYLADLKNNPQDVVVNPHFAGQVSEEATAARGDYAVAKRSEDIDEALDKAQRQAASGGSGGNINNAIRQQLKSLRNNKKKMTGWTDDEKAELDTVINGTGPSNAARSAGKFAPHGIVSTVMSYGIGHAIAPGIGEVAVPGIGWITKKIGDHLTTKAAERLSNFVKARSPLGKQNTINAAAQSAFSPTSQRGLLPPAVAAALPKGGVSFPQIGAARVPATAQDTDKQNPRAGFSGGGNVNRHDDSGGKVYSSNRGATEKALKTAYSIKRSV